MDKGHTDAERSSDTSQSIVCLPGHLYCSSIQEVEFYLCYINSCFDNWKQKFHVSTSKEAIQVSYLPNPSLGDQPPQSEEAQAAIVKIYMKENTTSPELPDNVQASQLPACETVTGLAATEFY